MNTIEFAMGGCDERAPSQKVGKKARRNFELYLRVWEEMQPCIGPEPIVVEDPGGVSALEAFDAKDSQGRDMPCRENDLLRRVLRAKGSLNLQIKQWAKGVSDGLFLIEEFAEGFPWLPDWVWDAVLNQAKKRIMDDALDRIGKQTGERLEPPESAAPHLFFFLPPSRPYDAEHG